MPEDQNLSGGQTQEPAVQDKQEIEKDVPYSTYKKAVNEKRNRDAELKSALEQIEKYKSERRALEEQTLKEKEDYKKLFEARDLELKAEIEKKNQLETYINSTKKLNSFLKTLNTPIKEQYLGLIDLDRIALDESGKPDELTTKQLADEFKKTYPELFFQGGSKIPNESANGSHKAGLSYEQWLKLPPSEQKKRMKEVI